MTLLSEREIMNNWGESIIPQVSIICQTFNHAKYIRIALDSFLMQTTTFPFEIIVHDDASNDSTVKIIKEYENKYPNIVKPIYQLENQYSKHIPVYNTINEKMSGKYVAFCEGDDYWTDPSKLQKQYDALENNEDCTIAFHRVQFVDNAGEKIDYIAPREGFKKEGIITLRDYCNEEFKEGFWTFHTSSFFLRRDIFLKYIDFKQDYFEQFPYSDMVIILHALLNGNGFYIDKTMGCYRLGVEGGYNTRRKENLEFDEKQNQKVSSGLAEFDKLMNYEYHSEIITRINRENLQLLVRKFQIAIDADDRTVAKALSDQIINHPGYADFLCKLKRQNRFLVKAKYKLWWIYYYYNKLVKKQ